MEAPEIENIEGLFDDVLNRFARMAYDFEEFAGRDVTMARNMIKALVGGKIVFQPTKDRAGRYDGGLNADMNGHFSGLVELVGKAKAPRGKAGGYKLRMVAGARNQLYLLIKAKHLYRTCP